MYYEVILQQKHERDQFLAAKYVVRDKLTSAAGIVESPLIKVITGPRRAGKSVFSIMLLKGKKFAYVNFDDDRLLGTPNTDEIIKSIHSVYGDVKFVLFDEIQNLPAWEIFVNKMQRRGYNVVLTGSNSRLLSTELATHLTGRHFPIEILPFSFAEFLRARKVRLGDYDLGIHAQKGNFLKLVAEFMSNGGFPEVVVHNLDSRYLQTLFDSIILKDIVRRRRVRSAQKIYELASYLTSNSGCDVTFSKLKNTLSFNSVLTVEKYAGYVEEAYLCTFLSRFSNKLREQMKAAKKVYCVDNGLISSRAFQLSRNSGRMMENLVFSELLKRGLKPNQSLFYYATRNYKQVDFVIRTGTRVSDLIQVCYESSSQKTFDRETNALLEAGDELGCKRLTVITWDESRKTSMAGKEVVFRPLWEWLLVTGKPA